MHQLPQLHTRLQQGDPQSGGTHTWCSPPGRPLDTPTEDQPLRDEPAKPTRLLYPRPLRLWRTEELSSKEGLSPVVPGRRTRSRAAVSKGRTLAVKDRLHTLNQPRRKHYRDLFRVKRNSPVSKRKTHKALTLTGKGEYGKIQNNVVFKDDELITYKPSMRVMRQNSSKRPTTIIC